MGQRRDAESNDDHDITDGGSPHHPETFQLTTQAGSLVTMSRSSSIISC